MDDDMMEREGKPNHGRRRRRQRGAAVAIGAVLLSGVALAVGLQPGATESPREDAQAFCDAFEMANRVGMTDAVRAVADLHAAPGAPTPEALGEAMEAAIARFQDVARTLRDDVPSSVRAAFDVSTDEGRSVEELQEAQQTVADYVDLRCPGREFVQLDVDLVPGVGDAVADHILAEDVPVGDHFTIESGPAADDAEEHGHDDRARLLFSVSADHADGVRSALRAGGYTVR